eukprot:scaffold13390_cov96-Skeletonema_marinoi.AAC.4
MELYAFTSDINSTNNATLQHRYHLQEHAKCRDSSPAHRNGKIGTKGELFPKRTQITLRHLKRRQWPIFQITAKTYGVFWSAEGPGPVNNIAIELWPKFGSVKSRDVRRILMAGMLRWVCMSELWSDSIVHK